MNSRSAMMYPIIPEKALIMSIAALERTSLSQCHFESPMVRAATILRRDSATEVVDVTRLSERNPTIVQYVDIADSKGRLYCVDRLLSTSRWLKIITLAKDCQSCNVLLMTSDKGVFLKTIRSITPGEPLLMWFTENILAMLDMPFLTPSNIQGQNRYICHMCHNLFEYPNPLKIHLATKCNRLDLGHLWTILAKEFKTIPKPTLSLSLFPQRLPPFKFELSSSPQISPTRTSPSIMDKTDPSASLIANSPPSSEQPSPTSSTPTSPISSTQTSPNSTTTNTISPSSSTSVSPVKKNLEHRHSAFKPYMNNQTTNIFPTPTKERSEENRVVPFHHVPATAPLRTDVHAAQMETIVSNLGRSKQGHLCIYCGKVYSRKYGLKIHIRTHTGYKPLKCKYCLRPFGDPSNLNKHVRLHADGETPYRCELCSKVLVRRRDLERHIRSRHQGVIPDNTSDVSSDGMDV